MSVDSNSKTSTTIILIRHGLTSSTGKILPGRTPGLFLSNEGISQAQKVGQRIAKTTKLDALYSSPMERTIQTAQQISKFCNIDLQIDEGLLECDFGSWTGKELKELMKDPAWQNVQHWPSGFSFPQGESFLQMQHRITSTLSKLQEKHIGQTIAAVSHADPIKAALAYAMGIHLDLFQRLIVSPCSMSILNYNSLGINILGVNNICELPLGNKGDK